MLPVPFRCRGTILPDGRKSREGGRGDWRIYLGNLRMGTVVLHRLAGIRNKRLVNNFNLRQEAVSAPGDRLNKARILGRVAQDFPDFLDGVVQPMLGVVGTVG